MRRALAVTLVIGLAAAGGMFWKEAPALKRYLKIRKM